MSKNAVKGPSSDKLPKPDDKQPPKLEQAGQKKTTEEQKNASLNKNDPKNKNVQLSPSPVTNPAQVKETEEEIQARQNNANNFERYISESGIALAFQLVFSELVSKHIQPENYFSYTAMRLRQIGKEVEELKNKYKSA